jgi:hypothetical protein
MVPTVVVEPLLPAGVVGVVEVAVEAGRVGGIPHPVSKIAVPTGMAMARARDRLRRRWEMRIKAEPLLHEGA